MVQIFERGTKKLEKNQKKYPINKEGEVVLNFGKYNGRTIKDVVRFDEDYASWLLTIESLDPVIRQELENLKAYYDPNIYNW